MGTPFTKDMNIITNFLKDMDIIAALDDQPNDVGGLTAAELKAKFDEGGKAIQSYINDTLIPEVVGLDATEAERKAAETIRLQSEAARVTAEQGRVTAEEARAAADAERDHAEYLLNHKEVLAAVIHLRIIRGRGVHHHHAESEKQCGDHIQRYVGAAQSVVSPFPK